MSGKAGFFWWWHPPLIGGCPWVHPCGHPDTPTPPQTPFLPSGTCSTTSDTVPVERGSDGAPFFRFFHSIHDPYPHPVTLCPPQEVAMLGLNGVTRDGITGDVDIDGRFRFLCCTLAFAIGIRDFSPISCPSELHTAMKLKRPS